MSEGKGWHSDETAEVLLASRPAVLASVRLARNAIEAGPGMGRFMPTGGVLHWLTDDRNARGWRLILRDGRDTGITRAVIRDDGLALQLGRPESEATWVSWEIDLREDVAGEDARRSWVEAWRKIAAGPGFLPADMAAYALGLAGELREGLG